ncbi:MAG: STAS domain-containing protein [Solirubrobacterales bacterium]
MRYEISDESGGPTLVLRDQLTFGDRSAFEGVIAKLLARRAQRARVDLSALEYMDSAGLGMLLTLRDQAERAGMEVALKNPKAEVRELLVLACFDTLFAIEED